MSISSGSYKPGRIAWFSCVLCGVTQTLAILSARCAFQDKNTFYVYARTKQNSAFTVPIMRLLFALATLWLNRIMWAYKMDSIMSIGAGYTIFGALLANCASGFLVEHWYFDWRMNYLNY
jgi:MFS family permease